MTDYAEALMHTVPISQFNKGMAGKIFEDVRKNGVKVVMKNNAPECVLVSPEEYIEFVEEKRKMREKAIDRLMEELKVAEADDFKYGGLSEKEIAKKFGVTL